MSKHDLIQLLATQSVRRGEFTLASGRSSSLYIDARLTTMSPQGLTMIGALGLGALERAGWYVDAVGGMTLGADPIAYAIAYASASTERPLRAFTVRKEIKSHGARRLIEGPFHAGDHIAVIEDVITTGNSALTAAKAVADAGGKIVGILALIDREEGGREALEAHGFSVIALTSASEITTTIA